MGSGLTFDPADHVRILELGGLTVEQAVEALLAASDDSPMLPREIRALAERSMGSPMFLEELWRAHRAGAPLDALPDSVDSAVTAQIDHLSATDRQVLRYAAVLGTTFTGRELIDLLQPELEGSESSPEPASPGTRGVPQHRAVRADPVPLGDRARLRLRGTAVQTPQGAPRTGGQRPAGPDR